MKITINRTVEKVFQGAAIVSLATIFLSTGFVYAQQTEVSQPLVSTSPKPSELQANIFGSLDPFKLKIVFVNPSKEPVTLLVKDDKRETLYKKVLKNIHVYNSSFDVYGLPDGNYTFEVIGTSSWFSKEFQISTQMSRLTHVQ